jgi:hypothetical protein
MTSPRPKTLKVKRPTLFAIVPDILAIIAMLEEYQILVIKE